ncbi:MAG: hypothetical protein A3H96_27445 [Acidobacteria bacterium RIFCSPLOWO2_02_FULL_67_36]|nr:MAG: hypothetical protein A3H96_27445 [Acidobacteria bacterium RIFCSPLOWO2_02_FULL_67_36]
MTPPIPDISARETFAGVAGLWPASPAERARAAEAGGGPVAPAYACLRSTRSVQTAVAIARDFSPRIERHGAASVVLDVSGLGRLVGDGHAIAAELERAAGAAGGIRIAVAPSQTAARLLAIARFGPSVVTTNVAAAVADLPIAALRQLLEESCQHPSAPLSTRQHPSAPFIEVFARWGLKRLGEMAALPPADLSERMGQEGLALQRLARGADSAPLVPDPGVPRFLQSMELEWPIDALEPLSFVLARLLDPLSLALERADRGAAAIRLDLRLVDRTTHARLLQLPAAMRDARVLRTLLLLDLESHPPPAGIDIVTIEVDPAPARIVQYSLLERALPSHESLATLTARLGALVGERRRGSPVLADSECPDGFELEAFNPNRSAGARRSRGPFDSAAFRPRSGQVVLRRFRPPIAVRVIVERGRPVHVAIDRRGMPGGRVEQAAGPWRTSGAWWTHGDGRWDRDEWDVALCDESLCRLFRDRITERWFMDGILD